MKKFYRILALLLALCLFCTAASAAGITEEEEHNHGIVEEGADESVSGIRQEAEGETESSEPVPSTTASEAAPNTASAR